MATQTEVTRWGQDQRDARINTYRMLFAKFIPSSFEHQYGDAYKESTLMWPRQYGNSLIPLTSILEDSKALSSPEQLATAKAEIERIADSAYGIFINGALIWTGPAKGFNIAPQEDKHQLTALIHRLGGKLDQPSFWDLRADNPVLIETGFKLEPNTNAILIPPKAYKYLVKRGSSFYFHGIRETGWSYKAIGNIADTIRYQIERGYFGAARFPVRRLGKEIGKGERMVIEDSNYLIAGKILLEACLSDLMMAYGHEQPRGYQRFWFINFVAPFKDFSNTF